MTTVGHHTVEDRENPDFIEENAPFKCVSKTAFLGHGYYFWDNSLDFAHFWGETRYPGNYVICEATLQIKDESFLDLIGRRTDQMWLQEVWAKLEPRFKCSGWPLAKFIEFLKELSSTNAAYKGIFPFKVIRAVDNSVQNDKKINFNEKGHNYLFLNPMYIICVIEKRGILLENFRIIYPHYYVI